MPGLPTFTSTEAYVETVGNREFWRPFVISVLARHGLENAGAPVHAGRGSTFPTFICGEAVVKLFGHLPFSKRAYDAELAAFRCLAGDGGVLAPGLLAQGRLCDAPAAPWTYLITSRMPGTPWDRAALSDGGRSKLAADLGEQVRRLQTLQPISGVPAPEAWSAPGPAEAAARTALPQHLIAEVEQYIAGTDLSGNLDRVVVHGDLMDRHVFVSGERLAGIIDWGDALVTDPHYELAQLQLNLFEADKELLRIFLHHSDWPVASSFARQALVQAFHRQAVGLAQHRTMDVFHRLPALLPLEDIETLDELADAVFGL